MPKSKLTKPTTILGIDPGLADTGFGIIKVWNNNLTLVDFGCITTKAGERLPARLGEIAHDLNLIIKKYKPDFVAIEEIFFCKNVKTALKVGQSKGAILLTCQNNHLEIHEYTPLQVKQALSGYGRAEKNQIQQMVKMILDMPVIPKPDDAADALAVAICCANSLKVKD